MSSAIIPINKNRLPFSDNIKKQYNSNNGSSTSSSSDNIKSNVKNAHNKCNHLFKNLSNLYKNINYKTNCLSPSNVSNGLERNSLNKNNNIDNGSSFRKCCFCAKCRGLVIKLEDKSKLYTVSNIKAKTLMNYNNPIEFYLYMRKSNERGPLTYLNNYQRKRKDMVNFIAKLKNKYKVSIDSYFLAIELLDNVSAKLLKFEIDIELITIGCFFLAGKFIENDAYLGDFENLSNNFKKIFYSIDEMQKSEVFCLGVLDFNLSHVTAKQYYDVFCSMGFVFQDELNLVKNLNDFYESGNAILKEFVTDFQSTNFEAFYIAFSVIRYLREIYLLEKKRSRMNILEAIFNIKANSYKGAWELLKKIKNYVELTRKRESSIQKFENSGCYNNKDIENVYNTKYISSVNCQIIKHNDNKYNYNSIGSYNKFSCLDYDCDQKTTENNKQCQTNFEEIKQDLENPNSIQIKSSHIRKYSSKKDSFDINSGDKNIDNLNSNYFSMSSFKSKDNNDNSNLITARSISLFKERQINSNKKSDKDQNNLKKNTVQFNLLAERKGSDTPSGNDDINKVYSSKLPKLKQKFLSSSKIHLVNSKNFNISNNKNDVINIEESTENPEKIDKCEIKIISRNNQQLKSITTKKLININPINPLNGTSRYDCNEFNSINENDDSKMKEINYNLNGINNKNKLLSSLNNPDNILNNNPSHADKNLFRKSTINFGNNINTKVKIISRKGPAKFVEDNVVIDAPVRKSSKLFVDPLFNNTKMSLNKKASKRLSLENLPRANLINGTIEINPNQEAKN